MVAITFFPLPFTGFIFIFVPLLTLSHIVAVLSLELLFISLLWTHFIHVSHVVFDALHLWSLVNCIISLM